MIENWNFDLNSSIRNTGEYFFFKNRIAYKLIRHAYDSS